MFRKRIASLLLTVFSLGILCPVAQAVTKPIVRQLGFHSTVAQGFSQGDSLTVYRGTGVENSVQQSDTTAAFNTIEWVMPGSLGTTYTAQDTATWLRVAIVPDGGSPTVAADSIIATIQYSEDGTNWSVATPTVNLIAATTNKRLLETGTSNSFTFSMKQQAGTALGGPFVQLVNATARLETEIYGFPFVRFIFTGDHTGRYKINLTGFVPVTDS